MDDRKKVTPAMFGWLHLLAGDPRRYSIVRDGSLVSSRGSSSRGTPTRPMLKRMEAAGFIYWGQGDDPRTQIATLTAEGRAAATTGVQDGRKGY